MNHSLAASNHAIDVPVGRRQAIAPYSSGHASPKLPRALSGPLPFAFRQVQSSDKAIADHACGRGTLIVFPGDVIHHEIGHRLEILRHPGRSRSRTLLPTWTIETFDRSNPACSAKAGRNRYSPRGHGRGHLPALEVFGRLDRRIVEHPDAHCRVIPAARERWTRKAGDRTADRSFPRSGEPTP